MDRSKGNLRSDFIWNILGITLNSCYSIIILVFITNFIVNGIEEAGKFSYVFYISSVLSTIGNYGGRIYHISDMTNNYNDSNYISLKYISTLLMVIVGVLFVVLNGYNLEKMMLVLIFVLYRVFEAISDAYYGVMQKNNSLKNVGVSMSIKSIASMVLFCLLYIITNNLLIASSSFVIIFAIVYIFYDKKYCKKYEIPEIRVNNKTKELIIKCFPIFVFTFLSLVILNISRYFVDLRFDDVVQGYYSILILPASLMTLFIQFLLQPFLKKLVDTYKYNGLTEFKNSMNKIIFYFILGCGIILFCTYMFGTSALSLVYKINLEDYRFQLFISVAGGLLYGLVNIYSTALTIMRKINIQLFIYAISTVIVLIVTSLFLKTNINEAIYMYVMTMVVLFIMFWVTYMSNINKKN